MSEATDPGRGATPNPTTVTVLLEEVRRTLDDERTHGEGLDGRLGQLTGFAGVILTLIAPLGAAHLDDGNGALFGIFYVASVLLLAGAALMAVTSGVRRRTVLIGNKPVQLPWHRIGVEAKVLEEFSGPYTAEDTVSTEQTLIASAVKAIQDQRELNSLKNDLTRWVTFGLVGGLLAVAAQALTLAS